MIGQIFNMTGQVCMTPVIVTDHILALGTRLIFVLLWTVKYYVRIFFLLNFSFEFKLLNLVCPLLVR